MSDVTGKDVIRMCKAAGIDHKDPEEIDRICTLVMSAALSSPEAVIKSLAFPRNTEPPNQDLTAPWREGG